MEKKSNWIDRVWDYLVDRVDKLGSRVYWVMAILVGLTSLFAHLYTELFLSGGTPFCIRKDRLIDR